MISSRLLSMFSSQGNELLYYNIIISDSVLMEIIKRRWKSVDSEEPVDLF